MNLSRSAFGDYRPNLDALNDPRPETPLHSSKSPLTDADRDALETMMGLLSPSVPDTPAVAVAAAGESSGGGRGGSHGDSGAGGGGGGGDEGGGSEAAVSGAGGGRAVHYTKAESLAVARAWDAVTSDP
ncbi:zinc finger protein ZIC 2-like [Salvia splendens]|uniref:zinc finger protein ZIC 2-like n=1 Tax=Salvia splendens TaxID=180675 RepID=UPI001C264214|nr:zinc finger protein ZIC 2-like [Salvia splendens]